MRAIFGIFPLLAIPVIIYNLMGFTFGGGPDGTLTMTENLARPLWEVSMVAEGSTWAVSGGDLLIILSLGFFFIGGVLALVMRTELAEPGMQIVSQGTYNELFTIHGSTMFFLFAVPMSVAVGIYMVPLQIGASGIAWRAPSTACWAPSVSCEAPSAASTRLPRIVEIESSRVEAASSPTFSAIVARIFSTACLPIVPAR